MKLVNILNEGKYDSITTEIVRDIISALKTQARVIKQLTTHSLSSTSILQKIYWVVKPNKVTGRIPINVFVEIFPEESENKVEFAVEGALAIPKADPIAYKVQVTIYLRDDVKRDFKHLLQDISYNLKDVIRHELEHYDQFNIRPIEYSKIKKRLDDLRQRIFKYNGKLIKVQSVGPVGAIVIIPGHGRVVIPTSTFVSNIDDSFFNYLLQGIEVEAFVAGLYKQAKASKTPFTKLLAKFVSDGPNKKINNVPKEHRKIIYYTYLMYAKRRFPNIK